MRKKDQNPYQAGYPQQNGYPQGSYPGGAAYSGYPAQQGYQNQNEYQNPQGYPQATGYTQMQGYQAPRTYQTPQVPGGQPPAGVPENTGYVGQGSFAQNGYAQTGYTQPQNAGYPAGNSYPQQSGYPQQNGYPQANNPAQMTGYTYPAANQQPAGSYIPQTPYSPGYTTPGYQAPNGYAQGYNAAYTQMGRQQAPANPLQEQVGQVPLNGGGYMPPPVPVRKQPFMLTDAYLLIISATLLVLFVLGMFINGMGIMKWVFLLLTGGSIAALWLKNLTENNKRLCFSIVFGVLALVTLIGLVTGGGQGTRKANPQQQQQQQQQTVQDPSGNAGAAGANPYGAAANNPVVTPAPVQEETPVPEGSNEELKSRLYEFMQLWAGNDIPSMVKYCHQDWLSKTDNPSQALFAVTRNRIPVKYEAVSYSGTPYDTFRTVTINVEMNKNDGKPNKTYSIQVSMKKGADDLWYVDPSSIQSLESEEPTITPAPEPTPTLETYDNTPLYYNPDGGSLYHRDPNCKKVGDKYRPLQGQFTYGDLLRGEHSELKPCHICLAPEKPKN